MVALNLFKIIFILLHLSSVVLCTSYYTITAPGTIQSNRKYTACVSLHNAKNDATIRLSLKGPLKEIIEEVHLAANESKLVDFFPKKLLSDDKYILSAADVKQPSELKEIILNALDHNGIRIFIQTNKGIYKPSDLIQFRVIILDEHMKPLNIMEPIKVEILDANGIRIKQFKDITIKKGFYTGSFQLIEQPSFGTWKIHVAISGKFGANKLKSFQVEKYVLPKFSVHIEAVNDFPLPERILKATVYGRYTYGKYVQGTVQLQLFYYIDEYDNGVVHEQNLNIEGQKAEAEILLDDNIENLTELRWIGIRAILTESITGINRTAEHKVTLHETTYIINMLEDEVKFDDEGNPMSTTVQVKHVNGSAITGPDINSDTDVQAVIFKYGDDSECRAYLDKNGKATFTFKYKEYSSYKFEYKDSIETFPLLFSLSGLHSGKQCLNLKLKEFPLLGKDVTVLLDFCKDISDFVYVVVSHGNILHMERIHMQNDDRTKYTIFIKPSVAMIPVSYVFVYYEYDGAVIYNDIKLRFPDEFENKISLQAPSNAKPGEEITFNINAQRNSRVGLLAVDLRVNLLNSSYDLNKTEIFDELLKDISYSAPSSALADISGLLLLSNATFKVFTRGGPSLFNRGLTGISVKSDLQGTVVRSRFPEVWIFDDLDITNINTTLSLPVPDTLTTWLVTAFSINDITGFGMLDKEHRITVFQPFFISTNLPYSIKRGETVVIPISIFNYFNEDLQVEVTMDNSADQYDFVSGNTEVINAANKQMKVINVPGNNGKTTSFTISPKQLGHITIRLLAKSHKANDIIEEQLKVDPEGLPTHHTQAIFLNLDTSKDNDFELQNTSMVLQAPDLKEATANMVASSQYFTLSAGGDILSLTAENLNDLVLLPTGCGEQNMAKLVPNILVLQYLMATDKYDKNPQLVEKSKRFLETGYQLELQYRHKNGAFSVFGPGAKSKESNWLTAYVVRFFIRMMTFLNIDKSVIEKGLEYLQMQQLQNGEFPYTGHLFYPAHQNRYGFTAFVLFTFMENRKYAKKYQQTIKKGIDFLKSNKNNVNDIYSYAIMANVFQMANEPEHANELLAKLQETFQEKNGLKWWTENDQRRGRDVEITSYVLMALLDTSADCYPIFKWLIEQRNRNGGFKSTHDTVVGLQSLIKFSEKFKLGENNTLLKINYQVKNAEGKQIATNIFAIEPENRLVLQQHELPKATSTIELQIIGRGQSLLQFSYSYYLTNKKRSVSNRLLLTGSTMSSDSNSVEEKHERPNVQQRIAEGNPLVTNRGLPKVFNITTLAKLSKKGMIAEIEICYAFTPPKSLEKLTASNMVIMEINLPSGFIASSSNLENLLQDDLITRTDTKNSQTCIILYFDYLPANEENCLNIKADKSNDVENLQSSSIYIFDYYNRDFEDTEMYDVNK